MEIPGKEGEKIGTPMRWYRWIAERTPNGEDSRTHPFLAPWDMDLSMVPITPCAPPSGEKLVERKRKDMYRATPY